MKSLALSFLFFSSYMYMYVCMIDCCAFENLGFRAGRYIDVYVYLCIYIEVCILLFSASVY